jgi:hypothetical protein
MAPPLRNRVPYRHTHVVDGGQGLPPLSLLLRTRLPVRPARLVLQERPRPNTVEIVEWIRDNDPRRAADGADRKRAPHFPFACRGYIAESPVAGHDVAVRLWEEPSGRPLEGTLPRDWFADAELHKGMPFQLVTWMVEDDAGELVPRGRVERLGQEAVEKETEA